MMIHNFDPILIDFGVIQVRWYSLAYIFGILLGWWYGKTVLKKHTKNQKIYLENFDDLVGYIILVVGISKCVRVVLAQVLQIFLG